jgi:hypothetical protein
MGLLRYVESDIYPRIFTLECDTPVDVREIANIHIALMQENNGVLSFSRNQDRKAFMTRKQDLESLSEIMRFYFGGTMAGRFPLIDSCK